MELPVAITSMREISPRTSKITHGRYHERRPLAGAGQTAELVKFPCPGSTGSEQRKPTLQSGNKTLNLKRCAAARTLAESYHDPPRRQRTTDSPVVETGFCLPSRSL